MDDEIADELLEENPENIQEKWKPQYRISSNLSM